MLNCSFKLTKQVVKNTRVNRTVSSHALHEKVSFGSANHMIVTVIHMKETLFSALALHETQTIADWNILVILPAFTLLTKVKKVEIVSQNL